MTNPDREAAPRKRGRLRLAGTGFWAVMDQGLFSGSNFLLNVMLARWLTQGEYGVFGLAYSVLLFMGTAHTAFIIEPMLVFASGRHSGRFGTYLRAILRGHWLLNGAVAALPALVGVVMIATGTDGGGTLVACAVSAPFILLQWMLRKACYVHLQPRLAAYSGGLYLALMLGGLVAMRSVGWLTPTTAFGLLAFASVASSVILVRALLSGHDGGSPADVREFGRQIQAEHWRYGRWGIGAVLLGWFGTDVYYVALTIVHGFESTGALRASMNLIVPAKQAFVAISTVALPVLVSARRTGALRRSVSFTLLLFGSAGVLYAAVLVAFREPLVNLLYGASYQNILPDLLILAALPILVSIVRVLNTTLHAIEYPRGVFAGSVPSALVAISLGMFLVWRYDTTGAALGLVAGSLATALAMSVIVARFRPR